MPKAAPVHRRQAPPSLHGGSCSPVPLHFHQADVSESALTPGTLPSVVTLTEDVPRTLRIYRNGPALEDLQMQRCVVTSCSLPEKLLRDGEDGHKRKKYQVRCVSCKHTGAM
jgi:hypothetical protein